MKTSGPDWFALIGAVGGIFAVGWTLWRAYREREHIHVKFYAYAEHHPNHIGPVAQFEVVNTGTLPAYIVKVGTDQEATVDVSLAIRLAVLSES